MRYLTGKLIKAKTEWGFPGAAEEGMWGITNQWA
jgi:hypothetical protein